MKTILLMRHGHSNANHEVDDHDRPLSVKGIIEAQHIAQNLHSMSRIPQQLLVSTALRTQQTADELRKTWNHKHEIPQSNLRSLYLSGLWSVQQQIERVSNTVDCVLLLGHNPGWSNIVYQLTGHHSSLGTGNVVIMEHLSIDWTEAIRSHNWSLIRRIQPNQL